MLYSYPICFENGSATSPPKPWSTITSTVLEKTSLIEHHLRSTKATTVLEQTSRFDKSKDSGDESSPDESLPVGAIIGSIVGVTVCVGGVLVILVYLKRRHRKRDNGGQTDGNVKGEAENLSDVVKNENEINEASELLGNERSSELKKESVKDGCKEQAEINVKSEVSKPPEKVKNENEINETSKLLGNESSSKLVESRKDGCLEQGGENVKSEVSKLSGNKSSSEPKGSSKDGCKVFVVESQKLNEQTSVESQKPKEQTKVPKDKLSVRVLVLVLKNQIKKEEMDSKAKETFGKKYGYCWTLSYYQRHKQKENVSLFPQNFDFESVSVKKICERIRDVGLERDVNFVITVPLNVWLAQREELSSFLNADTNPCFKNEYW